MSVNRNDVIEIDIQKLLRMQTHHVRIILLDLRSAANFQAGHIPGAFNLPADEFKEKIEKMVPQKETPIVAYDNDGKGSIQWVLAAEKMGFLNIVNLEGGYSEYLKQTGSS